MSCCCFLYLFWFVQLRKETVTHQMLVTWWWCQLWWWIKSSEKKLLIDSLYLSGLYSTASFATTYVLAYSLAKAPHHQLWRGTGQCKQKEEESTTIIYYHALLPRFLFLTNISRFRSICYLGTLNTSPYLFTSFWRTLVQDVILFVKLVYQL